MRLVPKNTVQKLGGFLDFLFSNGFHLVYYEQAVLDALE